MSHVAVSQASVNQPPANRVAVLGCGYWGKNLVRNFEQLGALEMVCDATPAGRETARALAPGAEVVSSIEAVLGGDAAGVVIATPAETHYSLVKQAFEAGKDVFVEKPLALTYDQGAELVALAEAHGRILMVGHVLEYHPAVVALSSLVQGGELGVLRYVYSNRLSLGKVRREENVLWSFAPHDIAILLRLVGGMPSEIIARGGDYLQAGIADMALAQLLFGNGVRGHVYVSWLHPFKEQRLVVVGERKMASFDDVAKTLVLYDHSVELTDAQIVVSKAEGERIAFAADEPLRLECQAFLEALASRLPPRTDGRSGLRVLEVLQAAQRSLTSGGRPVALSSRVSQQDCDLEFSA